MLSSTMLEYFPLEMHYVGFVDAEDMNVVSGKRKYTSLVGYSSSKLAEIMFSSILNKRLPAEAGINLVCVSPGIVHTNVARDLPKIVQAGYHLISYFIFSPEEGSRSALFAATDPQLPEYCESLKSEDWPVCAFISHDCRPANPSEEAHDIETCYKVWEKTLELVGVERLIQRGTSRAQIWSLLIGYRPFIFVLLSIPPTQELSFKFRVYCYSTEHGISSCSIAKDCPNLILIFFVVLCFLGYQKHRMQIVECISAHVSQGRGLFPY